MPSTSTTARWCACFLSVITASACRPDLDPPQPVNTATAPKSDAGSNRDGSADARDGVGSDSAEVSATDGGTDGATETGADVPAAETSLADAAIPVEVAPPVDVAMPPPTPPATPPDAAPPATPGCGTIVAEVSTIANVEALAVGKDGTIYFAQSGANAGWLGRLKAGAAAAEPRWLTVPNGSAIWGLTTDDSRQRLYVASSSGHLVQFVSLAGSAPSVEVLTRDVHEPDDLAIGPGGQLYFPDSDNHLYRVTPGGELFRVSNSSFGATRSTSLAFLANGDLLVGTLNNGPIFRLAITPGGERSRAPFGAFRGMARALAVDAQGSVYVVNQVASSESQLMRIAGDGSGPALVSTGPALTSLAFGRGMLSCQHLYVGSRTGPMMRISVPAGGLAVP